VWPDTPQDRGIRLIRRQPLAVTSGKYQELVERNLSKAAEEKAGQV
jgi:hypothetical protein